MPKRSGIPKMSENPKVQWIDSEDVENNVPLHLQEIALHSKILDKFTISCHNPYKAPSNPPRLTLPSTE